VIERDWSRSISPTALIVETDCGTYAHRIDYPRGNNVNPMSADDFEAKLRDCMDVSGLPWPQDLPHRLRRAIGALRNGGTGRDLVASMMPLAG
jgi:2-methylcitrate dehydratase PrpD